MSEKRFKKISVCGDWGIKDVQNDKVLFFGTTYEVNDTLKVLNELNDENKELKNENEQLKQDRFICLDCEHSGYTEIGCLCEKKDHWTDYKTECEDYRELE